MQELINLLEKHCFVTEKCISFPVEEFKYIKGLYRDFIPNEYTKVLNEGYFDKDCVYTEILYKAFWTILELHKSSALDFNIINTINHIYLKSSNPLESISDNHEVLTYLNKKKGKTYNEYKNEIVLKYGFDIDEYRAYKLDDNYSMVLKNIMYLKFSDYTWKKSSTNICTLINCKSSLDELYKYSYRSYKRINTTKYINFLKVQNKNNTTSYFNDGRETLEDNNNGIKYSTNIQKRIYAENSTSTIYEPKYKFPKLNALEINHVSFKFSILDKNLDDLIEELKNIYKSETINYRNQLGSFGTQLFEKKQPKYKSAKDLIHVAVIYHYQAKCDCIDDAYWIYCFHILLHHEEELQYTQEDVILKHKHILTEYTFKKEVKSQINKIISILNLD